MGTASCRPTGTKHLSRRSKLAGADPQVIPQGTVARLLIQPLVPVVAGVKPKHIQIREAGVFKKGGAGYGTKAKKPPCQNMRTCAALVARCPPDGAKRTRWGLSLDWFEPYTGFVVRWESSWTTNALLNDTAKIDLMGRR